MLNELAMCDLSIPKSTTHILFSLNLSLVTGRGSFLPVSRLVE